MQTSMVSMTVFLRTNSHFHRSQRFGGDWLDSGRNHECQPYSYCYFLSPTLDIWRVEMMKSGSRMNLHCLVSCHLHVAATKRTMNSLRIVSAVDGDVPAIPDNHNRLLVHC